MNAAAALTALAVAFAPVSALAPEPFDALAPVLAPAGDPLDAALDGDRSLLSFLPDDVRTGRYSIPVEGRFQNESPVQNRVGVFWRTSSGNVYTRTEPYDEELVRREVRALVEHFERRREESHARARAEGRDPEKGPEGYDVDEEQVGPLQAGVFHDGAEYQWPFWEVVLPMVRPVLSQRVFVDRDCRAAVEELEQAVREQVNALVPDFRPAGARERWTLDVRPMRTATAGLADAARSTCGTPTDSGTYRERAVVLHVERARHGLWLGLVDEDGDVGKWGEVRVTPADAGPPPVAPDPAPRHPALNDFLMAVAACRALPWEYSDFAASDSYYPPYSDEYNGPTAMFPAQWVCPEDVPQEDVERAAKMFPPDRRS